VYSKTLFLTPNRQKMFFIADIMRRYGQSYIDLNIPSEPLKITAWMWEVFYFFGFIDYYWICWNILDIIL